MTTIAPPSFANTITGSDGNDTLIGTEFDDYLVGGAGADSLSGGKGNDWLDGSDGNDTMSAQGNATMVGGAGNDLMSTTGGDKLLGGGDGDDRFYVQTYSSGTVLAQGGAGDDKFYLYTSQSSAQGTITLDGGDGNDVFNLNMEGSSGLSYSLRGGAGADLYKITAYTPTVAFRIGDFHAGAGSETDRIDISVLVRAMSGYQGGNPFSPSLGYFRLVQSGADTLLQFDQDGVKGGYGANLVATLVNLKASDLSSDNFTPYSLPDGGDGPGQLLDGSAAAEYMVGSVFADTINGGAGNDTLWGDYGDDALSGGDGDDQVYDYWGSNTLHGGAGNDSVYGPGMLYGDEGNDTLIAYTGVVDGGAGDDSLIGDKGDATLLGGTGNDRFRLSNFGPAALVADGGDGDDVFIYQQDSFYSGLVKLSGGAGVDTYAFGSINNSTTLVVSDFVAGAGGDRIDVSTLLERAASYGGYHGGNPFAAASGMLRLVQTGADTVVQIKLQYNYADLIKLSNVATGTLTADNFVGGFSPDGSASPGVTLVGSDGSDTLVGSNNNDRLEGGAGADLLQGQAGGDVLLGGDETGDGPGDTLDGGEGNDKLDGGAGNDSLLGGGGNDSLYGGQGNDTLSDNSGNNLLSGGDGNDVFWISAASVTSMTVEGGAGDDLFQINVGSAAQSIATGGLGRDTYQLAGSSNFRITDFATGAGGDRLDLIALLDRADFNGYRSGNPFAAEQPLFRLVQSGADTLVQQAIFDYGTPSFKSYSTLVTLSNVTATALTADNFIGNIDPTGAYTPGARMQGSAGNDELIDTHFNDTLLGGAGNDTLRGSRGDDLLDGGGGDDLIAIQYQRGAITVAGGAGNDSLLVSDSGVSGSGVRTLRVDGGSGDDFFSLEMGRTGLFSSTLSGGEGRDTYFLDELYLSGSTAKPDTYVIEDFTAGPGGDRIDLDEVLTFLTGTLSYKGGNPFQAGALQLNQQGDDAVLQMQGYGNPALPLVTLLRLKNVQVGSLSADNFADNIDPRGNPVSGMLIEHSLASGFRGGLFNDTLLGAESMVMMYGGGGDDLIKVSGKREYVTLLGESGNDTLLGDSGDEVYSGGPGDDVIDGGAGNDVIFAGDGHDVVDGGDGTDLLVFSASFDSYTVQRSDPLYTIITDANANSVKLSNVESFKFNGVAMTLAQVRANYASSKNDYLIGNSGDNTLSGLAGDDTLDGGAGADRLIGGIGNDTYVVDDARDSITENAGEGTDTVQTTLASYTLGANLEQLVYTGSAAFAGTGNALNNMLSGGAAADTLNGAQGADTMVGGDGDDTYVVDNVADVIIENAGAGIDLVQLTAAGSYTLSNGVENGIITAAASAAANLAGNSMDNLLTGNGLANTLTGGDGNDTLDGGAGGDKLIGGAGDDTYIVDASGDSVTELPGEGNDTVRTSLATYALGANVENLLYTGSAAFTGGGNALDNVITGGAKGNKLDGGAGNDSLSGGNGNDSLIGGIGNDTLLASAGKDTIDGGDGIDLLRGLDPFNEYSFSRPNATDTVLTDKAGNTITVRGVEAFDFWGVSKTLDDLHYNIVSVGNDKLYGDNGQDTLDGGAGADTMTGYSGDDTYIVDNAGDVVVEDLASGHDLVLVKLASTGTYQLSDYVEDATVASTAAINLSGNASSNYLTGNAAANVLSGGAGDDTLDGGSGADKLAGGASDDVYLVDNAGDQVTEAQDQGRDLVQTTLASYTLGANVEDLSYTGKGAFNGTGNAGDNQLRGSATGANKLDGGAGDDLLIGGAGADSLLGGSGNDTLIGGRGKDIVDGGAGDDAVLVDGYWFDFKVSRPNASDTVLTDSAGNTITLRNVETVVFYGSPTSIGTLQYNIVSPGDDVLVGRENVAPETMDGGLGADTMSGGGGDDTYIVDNLGDTIIEDAGGGMDTARVTLGIANASYTLGENVENGIITSSAAVNLSGNAVNNALTGNAAANTLSGGAGDDTLDGGAGADKLIGGSGDDVYIVADSSDVVIEAPDEGYDTVRTTLASYTLGAHVEQLDYLGKAAFSGTGNAQDNVIHGGNGGARLDGGAGNDSLAGGAGNDSLLGGLGDDTLSYSGGKDTIDGGDGIDELYIEGVLEQYTVSRPHATDLVLTGPGGKLITVRNVENFNFWGTTVTLDQLTYNMVSVGNDKLYGSNDQDTLNGSQGADTMTGYGDDDRYVVDNAGDVIVEEAYGGTDTVQVELTTAGSGYTLSDYVENGFINSAAAVNLSGNALNNRLTGNAAANTLSGGAGGDTLDGGAGNDKLIGGEGDDVYLVADAGDQVSEAQDQGHDQVQTVLASYTLSANVEELVFTGKGAFSGTGNADDNVLKGGNGGARLDGGAGNDLLLGGSGNDSLLGGSGNDTLDAGAGKDTVDGGSGSDIAVLPGAPGNYSVTRPTATDTVFTDSAGNSVTLRNVEFVEFSSIDHRYSVDELQYNLASPGADHLSGTPGTDTLNGGAGADTLEGGAGNDVYVISDKAAVIVEQADGGIDLVQVAYVSAGTYTLADNVEFATVTAPASVAVNLTGNDEHNWLTGNGAANTLSGAAGNDTLDGGAGADKMIGGGGDDVYLVSEAGDVVLELADEGFDSVSTTLSSYSLGAHVEAVFAFGSGMFTGTGNAQGNLLVAGSGGSRLDGGAGDDWLIGGMGNDSLLGGLGDDVFDASQGKDTVDGGVGNNALSLMDDFSQYTVLRVSGSEALLTHLAGATTLVRNVQWFDFNGTALSLEQVLEHSVSMGSDTVLGTSGGDTLDGGPGNDVLIGGDGDDYYLLSAPGDQVVEQADAGIDGVRLDFSAPGSYTLADNVEYALMLPASTVAISVVGNGLSNYLSGNAGANSLNGGGGNDTLDGGAGNDTLTGGLGDDHYLVGNSGDVIKENAGEGYETVFAAAASYTLSANLEDLVFKGSGAFTGVGNTGDNRLFAGSSSGAKLDGGSGNDTLVGAAGNDNLIGGAGDDRIESNGGSDTVDGGAGNDYLLVLGARDSYSVVRTAADTVLTGSDGKIVTVRGVETFYFADQALTLTQLQANTGGPGNDSLMGSDGNDTLDGGAGADTLAGGAGDDVYRVDHSADRVTELAGGGIDRVETALASYTLGANVENLRYTGTAAFTGTGNALDNILQGGAGSDKLTGGLGSDTFVVAQTTGSDIVTDFAAGVDHLALDLAALGLARANLRMGQHDAPGGFAVGDQLSLFTARAASSTTASAAAVIGSASSAYAVGDTALFVVATAKDSTLYRFVSSGADAQVSAGELTALVTLTGAPATTLDDYLFV